MERICTIHGEDARKPLLKVDVHRHQVDMEMSIGFSVAVPPPLLPIFYCSTVFLPAVFTSASVLV